MHTLNAGYRPYGGPIARGRGGSLVATETGTTTAFGLHNAEARGSLFLSPGVEVYAGQVVGLHAREGDLEVNVCKRKHLTNMRASTSDETLRLKPPRLMSLEDGIEFLADDELVEVTPKSVRLRKRTLRSSDRKRTEKAAAEAVEP